MWKTAPPKSKQNLFDLFNPHEAYKLRTLEELNSSVPELNALKSGLSKTIGFYLKGHESEFDIPRLCRALAAPDAIAAEFMEKEQIAMGPKTAQRLDDIYFTTFAALNGSLHPRTTIGNNKEKGTALLNDLGEMRIYLRMYCDIELVHKSPQIKEKYPFGNPFEPIVEIMSMGAAIARFKYVTDRRTGEEPNEKVVSYHPLIHNDKAVLGVHVEGDEKFSMFKFWGNGDETLAPISEEYKGRIIRWGKEDALAALRGVPTDEEFLY